MLGPLGTRLVSVPVLSGGNGQKLMHRKLHLNTRKKFFTVWVTEHQNRLPREGVEGPLLEVLQSRLDAFLCNVL